jgi:DNA-binding transcriptional MerR regulator
VTTGESDKGMNIGELARQTGVSIRSLRYYELKQLLSSQRGDNGYRTYDSTAIGRVQLIQFYLGLGLSTNEIFDVVFCSRPDDVASLCNETDHSWCPGEIDFYRVKLAEIEAQLAALEKAKFYLEQRMKRWRVEKNA